MGINQRGIEWVLKEDKLWMHKAEYTGVSFLACEIENHFKDPQREINGFLPHGETFLS